jgi:hypothetical protein
VVRDTPELNYGCRSEYGPLELRIQTTPSLSGFIVYVEDPRLENRTVHEHALHNTLETAKEYAASQADEYLNRHQETASYEAVWRCS